jgi:hypothetical protein
MNKRQASVRNHGSTDYGSANHRPSDEAIAMRAYELYIARGATPGSDLDDWLQAERELIERNKDAAPRQYAAMR